MGRNDGMTGMRWRPASRGVVAMERRRRGKKIAGVKCWKNEAEEKESAGEGMERMKIQRRPKAKEETTRGWRIGRAWGGALQGCETVCNQGRNGKITPDRPPWALRACIRGDPI